MITFGPSEPFFKYSGRFNPSNPNEFICSFSSSTISFITNARSLTIFLKAYIGTYIEFPLVEVYVNDSPTQIVEVKTTTTPIDLIIESNHEFNKIDIFKRSEAQYGDIGFLGVQCKEITKFIPIPDSQNKFLFFGDSITAGYACEAKNELESFSQKTENPYHSFAAICARHFNAEYHTIAFSGKGIHRNYGDIEYFSECLPNYYKTITLFSTSPEWNSQLFIPNIVFINLGTNDASPPLGLHDEKFVNTYIAFLSQIQNDYQNTPIVLLSSQMLDGGDKKKQIELLQEIKTKANSNVIHICNLSTQGEFGYGGDWHPNIRQNNKNAQELISFIELHKLIKILKI